MLSTQVGGTKPAPCPTKGGVGGTKQALAEGSCLNKCHQDKHKQGSVLLNARMRQNGKPRKESERTNWVPTKVLRSEGSRNFL